jgi:hypothetical protein
MIKKAGPNFIASIIKKQVDYLSMLKANGQPPKATPTPNVK